MMPQDHFNGFCFTTVPLRGICHQQNGNIGDNLQADKDLTTTTDPLTPTTMELVSGSWYGNDLLWDDWCDFGVGVVPGEDNNGAYQEVGKTHLFKY